MPKCNDFSIVLDGKMILIKSEFVELWELGYVGSRGYLVYLLDSTGIRGDALHFWDYTDAEEEVAWEMNKRMSEEYELKEL